MSSKPTLDALPPGTLAQLGRYVDYASAMALRQVIRFDDKLALREKGTLLKIEKLADIIISVIDDLPSDEVCRPIPRRIRDLVSIQLARC